MTWYEIRRGDITPRECREGCSFNPTSMNDYCSKHRPRNAGEMRVGDWVSTAEGRLYEVVEILRGHPLWCSDSLSQIDPELVTEIRTSDGRIYRRS